MINYCNERLQQLFLELTLGSEQTEYIVEVRLYDTLTQEMGRLKSSPYNQSMTTHNLNAQ